MNLLESVCVQGDIVFDLVEPGYDLKPGFGNLRHKGNLYGAHLPVIAVMSLVVIDKQSCVYIKKHDVLLTLRRGQHQHIDLAISGVNCSTIFHFDVMTL